MLEVILGCITSLRGTLAPLSEKKKLKICNEVETVVGTIVCGGGRWRKRQIWG